MRTRINRSVKLRLLIATFFFMPLCLFSQIKKTRILFLLDASSSMTYPWSPSYTRFEVASNILLNIMDSVYSINNEIEFAVRAYGTIYPAQLQNCVDTRLEVPFNVQNIDQIKTRLKNLTPIGSSPIAYSLGQASENELDDTRFFDYSVIFITDGGESCNGDVCGIYQKLLMKKISIKPYIIGLDKNEHLQAYYACLGNYIDVSVPEDIQKAVNLIIDANRSIIEKPRQLKLVTTYSNVKVIKDSLAAPVVVKKDTVIPVVKEIPVVVERNNALSVLRIARLPLHVDRIDKIHLVNYAMPYIKSATLHLNIDEQKKSGPAFEFMNPLAGILSRKLVKLALTAKKSNLRNPKKATLRFEYEEAKKESAVFPFLSVATYANMKKSNATILAKKSTLKQAKKVSLAFEYEEPKKMSPVFELLNPSKKPNLKKSVASIIAKKSTIKTAKKVSLAFEYDEPKKVSPPLAEIHPAYASIKRVASKAALLSKKSNIVYAKKASLRFEYEVPKKDTIIWLRYVRYPKRYSYANKLPDTREMAPLIAKMQHQKAILHFKVEEKKVVKKDTIMPDPGAALTNNIEFKTEVAASKETMVQVYFKNPNGKTYPTAKPMIIMLDAVTSAEVSSFKRDMSGNEPVPQPIAPGKYNLVIKGFDDLYANNIEIKPKTTTKVIVKVEDGSLQFRYSGNIKRPMTEYNAIVNRRFAAGSTVKQNCAEKKLYEPGTYYVEVDCLPPYKRVIELAFGMIYELQIAEPGTLAIMNTNALGKIQLQTTLGDGYVTFYTMNITGDPESQRINLISGLPLKIIYPADPKAPEAGKKELPIKLSPNNTMELELK